MNWFIDCAKHLLAYRVFGNLAINAVENNISVFTIEESELMQCISTSCSCFIPQLVHMCCTNFIFVHLLPYFDLINTIWYEKFGVLIPFSEAFGQ